MSIRKDAQHDVVCGGVMDEGSLRVDKEDIRDPDLLHQTAVERHTLVGAAGEWQTLILPVVPEVQRHGEVLVGLYSTQHRQLSPKTNYEHILLPFCPSDLILNETFLPYATAFAFGFTMICCNILQMIQKPSESLNRPNMKSETASSFGPRFDCLSQTFRLGSGFKPI